MGKRQALELLLPPSYPFPRAQDAAGKSDDGHHAPGGDPYHADCLDL
jgi:hypothetical protein